MTHGNNTLPKSERLHSKKLIDELFAGGHSKSMSAFPLRVVYMREAPRHDTVAHHDEPQDNAGNNPSQMLISVPKRCFRRANKRNLVKRQVREAYRKNKHIIDGLNTAMAFVWLDGKLYPTEEVEKRVVSLLTRMAEKAMHRQNAEESR